MVKRCHLIGVNDIPTQVLDVGQSLVIGRNRQCRIRDIGCSRNHCTLTFDGKAIRVVYTKEDKSEHLTNGQTLKGIGFQYRITFVEDSDSNEPNNGDLTEAKTQLNDQEVTKKLINGSEGNRVIKYVINIVKTNCL